MRAIVRSVKIDHDKTPFRRWEFTLTILPELEQPALNEEAARQLWEKLEPYIGQNVNITIDVEQQ